MSFGNSPVGYYIKFVGSINQLSVPFLARRLACLHPALRRPRSRNRNITKVAACITYVSYILLDFVAVDDFVRCSYELVNCALKKMCFPKVTL